MVYYYRCYVNKHINDNVHCESFFSIIIRMNGVSNADDNIKSAILNKSLILLHFNYTYVSIEHQDHVMN